MENLNNGEQIIRNSIDEVIGERFGRYSKYVIQERALPDARDGLKPVQRRILYAMDQLGLYHDKAYKKSARIVGEVIGKYHPHGDTSVYDAMVRLSQVWKVRLPLIDMHGNNGSIDGDGAAAMRYTETRLSAVSGAMLKDIEKKTVQFAPNFDDSEWEPTVLPASLPAMLINGATGIAAGYATNMPPHNINEIIDATIHRIDNPECRLSDITKIVKGPDFPTGGIVQGQAGIKDAFKTGKGRIVIRSTTEIEEDKKGNRIIVTEVPYEVNKANLVRKIDMIRADNKIPGISEVRDETDRNGLRISIDLKSGADTQNVLNYLYKNTDLQTYYSYNMVSIVDKKPQLLGIIALIDTYVKHRKNIVLNRTKYLLKRSKKRLSIVEGLIKAISNLEEVIKIIRASSNKSDAKKNLTAKFDFKEEQAEAIVTLRLYRLTSTDINELEEESKKLNESVKGFNEIVDNDSTLESVVKDELAEAKEKFGSERKSKVEKMVEEITIDQRSLIPNEECYVAVTRDGYIKRVTSRMFKANKVADLGKKDNDLVIDVIKTNTLDKFLAFTTKGNYIVIDVHKIKEISWKTLGTHINDYVKTSGSEKVITAAVVKSFKNKTKLTIASKRGLIKRLDFRTLESSRYSRAMKCINIKSNDEIVSVMPNMKKKQYIMVLTERGYAVKYLKEAISVIGPKGAGVRAINLKEEDKVVGLTLVNDTDTVMFVTSTGYAKRINVKDIPLSSRTTKGKYIAKPNKKEPLKLLNMFITTAKDVFNIDTGDTTMELKAADVPIFDVTQKFSLIKKKTFFAVTKNESFLFEDDSSDSLLKEDNAEIVREVIISENDSALAKLEKKLETASKDNDSEKTQVIQMTIDELLDDIKEDK